MNDQLKLCLNVIGLLLTVVLIAMFYFYIQALDRTTATLNTAIQITKSRQECQALPEE